MSHWTVRSATTAKKPKGNEMFIIIFGNLVDGYQCAGPFIDEAQAVKWAKASVDSWSVLPLLTPLGFPKYVVEVRS